PFGKGSRCPCMLALLRDITTDEPRAVQRTAFDRDLMRATEADHGFTISRDHRGPHPLPTSLLPVSPFDIGLLPSQLQPWITDACERLQCPGDYIAVSAMAAAGSVIGRKLLVRPHLEDDWAVVGNQWAICVGRPGVMKSPAMEEALRPIKQLSVIAEQ